MMYGLILGDLVPDSVDNVLRALIIAIGIAFGAALAAAVAAMILRLRHVINGHRIEKIEAVWTPRLLSLVVSGESDGNDGLIFHRLDAEVSALSVTTQRALLELIVRYAFVVTGSARRRLCRLAQPALPAARVLLGKRDPAFRALGVHIIGQLGLDSHEQAVIDALSDQSPIVGKTAARALARAGRVDYVEPILSTAARFRHWATSEVVSVLQEIGPAALPLLRSAFADKGRPTAVRVICAETLRWLNDLEAAGPAVDVVRSERDRELLSASLRLLRRVGSTEHAPFIRSLCTSHDTVVRLNAIAAISAVSDGTGGDVDRITMALADPSNWVAIRAARGLRELDECGPLLKVIAVGHPRANLARDVWPELEMQDLGVAA
jgi:hypothetical protein